MENLASFTQYYFRAYVIASGDTFYSKPATITSKGLHVVFDKDFKKNGDAQIVQVSGNETDGFYVLCYVSNFYSIVHSRLIKMDASGNELWSCDYNEAEYKWPQFMQRVNDGYVIATLNGFQPGDIRAVLMKVDFNGNKIWEKEFKKDAFQSFINLRPLATGFLLTIKSVNTNITDDPTRKVAIWDFTVSPNGNTTSQKQLSDFNAPNGPINPFSSLATPDGGFIGFGNYTNPVGAGYRHLIRLMKFNVDKQIQWDRYYEDIESEYLSTAFVGPDGNYIMASYGGFINSANNIPHALIFAVNQSTGSYLWKYNYSTTAGAQVVPLAMTYRDDGIYTTGMLSPGFDGKTDPFILKLDNSGTFAWDCPLTAKMGIRYTSGAAIFVASDYSIFIFGMRNENPSENTYIYASKLTE